MECVKEPTNNLWKLFRIMVYEMVIPGSGLAIPQPVISATQTDLVRLKMQNELKE